MAREFKYKVGEIVVKDGERFEVMSLHRTGNGDVYHLRLWGGDQRLYRLAEVVEKEWTLDEMATQARKEIVESDLWD